MTDRQVNLYKLLDCEKVEKLHQHGFDCLSIRIRNKIEVQPNGCWYWIGTRNGNYGCLMIQKKVYLAHRVVRHILRNDIPLKGTPTTILDHGTFCGIKKCVYPYHTSIGTHKDNYLTSRSASAIAFREGICKRGHSLNDSSNIYLTPEGARQCRVCSTLYLKEYNEKHKEERKHANQKYYKEHKDKLKRRQKIRYFTSKLAKRILDNELTREQALVILAGLEN